MASFALVLLVLAILAHRFAAIRTAEFVWVAGIAAAFALVALLLAALAFRRIWIEDDAGAGAAFVAVLLAAITFAPFAVALYAASATPTLSDVATDTADPPALTQAATLRDAGMNRVMPITPDAAVAIAVAYPQVVPRIYDMPLSDVTQAVLQVASERGFETVGRAQTDMGETTLEFVGRSLILRLPADVAVRLRGQGMRTQVDMRSASRYGSHDLGGNARRIAGFLDALDHEISVMQGVIVEEE